MKKQAVVWANQLCLLNPTKGLSSISILNLNPIQVAFILYIIQVPPQLLLLLLLLLLFCRDCRKTAQEKVNNVRKRWMQRWVFLVGPEKAKVHLTMVNGLLFTDCSRNQPPSDLTSGWIISLPNYTSLYGNNKNIFATTRWFTRICTEAKQMKT